MCGDTVDKEDKEIVDKLRDEFKKAYEKVLDETGVDGAYYEPDIAIWIRNPYTFKHQERVKVMDVESGQCLFCGEETMHYMSSEDGFVCPKCHGLLLTGVSVGLKTRATLHNTIDKVWYDVSNEDDHTVTIRQFIRNKELGRIDIADPDIDMLLDHLKYYVENMRKEKKE